jgi:coniferyl-aldehyde dehydrogenase
MSATLVRPPAGIAQSDMRIVFERMHAASRAEPAPDGPTRRATLGRLADALRARQDEFIDAISADFGNRSATETSMAEFIPLLGSLAHARANVARWMRPQRRRVGLIHQPGAAWVQRQPLGVVGVISPWNYPLLLSVGPLVDALAAGNRAMVKPSELTPRFSALLARFISELFEPLHVAVVQGDVDVAQQFSSLPFDHLLFTGSTSVGRHVMRAAAENLTPVTLELGGKSPAIVCADYDLAKAAKTIAFGKLVNAGQTCIATDYALVPAGRERAFADAVIAAARTMYPQIAGNPDYTSVASDRHFARLADAVAEAEAGGATVLRHEDSAAARERRLVPTVVLDAPQDCTLMREEIFGPVLPVVSYDSIDEAIGYVNARPRPLALYCFTKDAGVRDQVLARTVSGGATVNGTLMHILQDDLPFGGVGPSGTGAYHGRDGFLRFTHERGVFQPGGLNGFERFAPPYGALSRLAIRFLTGRKQRG